MRTYAGYLATQTVKTLNTVAKEMGLKGYSKLRKAELVAFIDNAIAALVPEILTVGTDDKRIAAILAPVSFSAAPVKALQVIAKPRMEVTTTEDEVAEVMFAYRAMRKTLRTARGTTQVKITTRLRILSAQLKGMGINIRTV